MLLRKDSQLYNLWKLFVKLCFLKEFMGAMQKLDFPKAIASSQFVVEDSNIYTLSLLTCM